MPQPFEVMTEKLQSAQNRLGFALRNFLKGYGLPYQEPTESKTAIFLDKPELAEHVNRLNTQYNLQTLTEKASISRYLETLTYLDWLDYFYQTKPDAFAQAFSGSMATWLDVGAKNWSYLEALTAFLQRHQPDSFELHGLEVDPNRRYMDLRTRKQYAETYLGHLSPTLQEKTHYHAGNVLKWRQPANIISHFLPFVFKEPHLAWGLPLPLFQPQAILQHELALLQPKGLLLIVNQGEKEAEAQQALLEQAARIQPIHFESLGQLHVRFIQYQYPRFGWICMKQGN